MNHVALRDKLIGEVVSKTTTWNPVRDAPNSEIKYIDLSAVDNVTKTVTGSQRLEGKDAPSRARQRVKAGDILVSTVRPNLNGVARVPDVLDNATASTGFCVLSPQTDKINPSYLFHWVQSPIFIDDMARKATGASYPAVSDKIIFQSAIPLPPLEEQKRIAAILDQADALRRLRQRAINRLNILSQAIFYEMFGRPDKNDFTASNFVELNSICNKITDGTHQAPKWETKGIPFIFVSNIRRQELSYDTNKWVSEETYNQLTKYAPIECGDILYTAVGSYGHAAVVDRSTPFVFQRHIAQIKPNKSIVDPIYLSYCMESQYVKQQADQFAKGVAQKTVTLSDIKKFQVPLPHLEKQHKFSSNISALKLALSRQIQHLHHSTLLFSSLQHRAFRGEL